MVRKREIYEKKRNVDCVLKWFLRWNFMLRKRGMQRQRWLDYVNMDMKDVGKDDK